MLSEDLCVVPAEEVPRDRFERLERLSQEFLERLSDSDREFFDEHIQTISAVMDDQAWNFRKTGRMIEMGGKHNLIEINLYKFPVLTDKAIIGLLAHEMAHAKDIENRIPKPVHSLMEWLVEKNFLGKGEQIYQWNEGRIDSIVREMGFEEEIEKLREENQTLDIRFGKRFEPEDVESPQVKVLELNCSNCNEFFAGKYNFNDFMAHPRMDKEIICNLEIHIEGVYVGVFRSDNPLSPTTLTEKISCPGCGNKSIQVEDISEAI